MSIQPVDSTIKVAYPVAQSPDLGLTFAKVEAFVNRHFAWVAFTAAVLVMGAITPGLLIMGAALGAGFHYYNGPLVTIKDPKQIVTPFDATVALVGAVASLLRLTPAGAAGGIVFSAIPFVSSFFVGGVVYRRMV